MKRTLPLIAVVDDDQGIRTALRRLLRSAHFEVETFPSGEAFLQSLSNRQPDCLVLDINMPQLDGLAVQQRLNQAGVRLPVVILTARAEPETRSRALAAGAAAYLLKPVGDESLISAINNAITPR